MAVTPVTETPSRLSHAPAVTAAAIAPGSPPFDPAAVTPVLDTVAGSLVASNNPARDAFNGIGRITGFGSGDPRFQAVLRAAETVERRSGLPNQHVRGAEGRPQTDGQGAALRQVYGAAVMAYGHSEGWQNPLILREGARQRQFDGLTPESLASARMDVHNVEIGLAIGRDVRAAGLTGTAARDEIIRRVESAVARGHRADGDRIYSSNPKLDGRPVGNHAYWLNNHGGENPLDNDPRWKEKFRAAAIDSWPLTKPPFTGR